MFPVRIGKSVYTLRLAWLCILGWQLAVAAQTIPPSAGPSGLPPGTVSGQVVNSTTGQPVPRALVHLGQRVMFTNFEGRFQFDQVTENAALLVTKPGFSMSPDPSSSRSVSIRPDSIPGPLTIRIYPEAVITAHVSQPDGGPIPGIFVSAQRLLFDGSAHTWIIAGGASTDSHGDARLPVSAGEYRLNAHFAAPNVDRQEAVLPLMFPEVTSTTTSQFVQVHSGEELRFDLHPKFRRTYPVSIQITGQTIPSHPTITAITGDGSGIHVNPQRGPVEGTERIDLPTGSYTLIARAGDQESAEMAVTSITVADKELLGVVLHLLPVPSIPFEVTVDAASTSDNSPVTPPTILQLGLFLESLQPDPDFGGSQIQVRVRRDGVPYLTVPFGSYRLRSRSAGQWYVKSATYGGSDLLREDLISAPGAGGTPIRLVVSNQTGTLQGSTLLDGKAAPGWVYLTGTTPGLSPVITLRSAETGSFAGSHIPPGTYQVLALEQPRQIDLGDPVLAALFSGRIQTVTIEAGMKGTLNLDEVPAAEIFP